MSSRELIALGTSSQVPTRERSHNSYLLRWDGVDFLLDPGEGTQRQLTFAGVATSSIQHICITHLHGDHCLGLAGIAQRLSLDRCGHPVHIYYPESGQPYIDRLCSAAIYQPSIDLVFHPVEHIPGKTAELAQADHYVLKAHPLDHTVPTIGFRIEEPEDVRFLPKKLECAGIHGPEVGELKRRGWIRKAGEIVRLEDVSIRRPGSVFAFVMDTRPCRGAVALAENADLLVMEATYTSEHQDLANLYFHSTASDAARTARDAGVYRLAMGHFSQRYSNILGHLRDAGEIFSNVIALNDLDRIDIPRKG